MPWRAGSVAPPGIRVHRCPGERLTTQAWSCRGLLCFSWVLLAELAVLRCASSPSLQLRCLASPRGAFSSWHTERGSDL